MTVAYLLRIVRGFSIIIERLSQDLTKQKNCKKLVFIHWSCMFGENMPAIAFTSWAVTGMDPLCLQVVLGIGCSTSFSDPSKSAISRSLLPEAFLGRRCVRCLRTSDIIVVGSRSERLYSIVLTSLASLLRLLSSNHASVTYLYVISGNSCNLPVSQCSYL